jgi:hypothetical protein
LKDIGFPDAPRTGRSQTGIDLAQHFCPKKPTRSNPMPRFALTAVKLFFTASAFCVSSGAAAGDFTARIARILLYATMLMNRTKPARVALAVAALLGSAHATAAPVYCSGQVTQLLAYTGGDLMIFSSWRSDYTKICNHYCPVKSRTNSIG